MTDILFYHLERAPLEKVLPVLLEKSLERGWNAVVEVGNQERLPNLDDALWTFSDDSFLPHAIAGIGLDEETPIILTANSDNPNGAQIRFFVDGAVPSAPESYERLVFMFSGHDPDAVTAARGAWRALNADNECTYWQQGADGRWSKKG